VKSGTCALCRHEGTDSGLCKPIIFPEGTRIAPGAASLKSKYKKGGFIFASRITHPVLPIAHNAGMFWPKHSFIKYPGVITVTIGEAFNAQGMKEDEVREKVEGWIKQELRAMDFEESVEL